MTQNIVAGIFERAKAARAKGKAAYSRSGIGVNPIKQKKGMSIINLTPCRFVPLIGEEAWSEE